MLVVVAPDSYKGSVSALGVAQAMKRGVLNVFPDARVTVVPIADGGEGTVEALVAATGGQFLCKKVKGPLGKEVSATWGILGDGETAVIEMAAASGLPLLQSEERNPGLTSTFGTGELIRSALDHGLRKIIIGIGGSATNDGGTGMAKALGIRFLDENGSELPEGGAALKDLRSIDLSQIDQRLFATEITVACDVDNPLCGPRGASAIFGPQKGATPDMVEELDAALAQFAACARTATGKDIENLPGAGAAGGMGAGMLYFTPAKLKPGVDIVLAAVNFETLVKDATFVITGEGRTDFQTAFGKAPVGIAKAAKKFGIPVYCISGGLGEGAENVLAQGVDAISSICDRPMPLEACMQLGEILIESSTDRLCRIIRPFLPQLKDSGISR